MTLRVVVIAAAVAGCSLAAPAGADPIVCVSAGSAVRECVGFETSSTLDVLPVCVSGGFGYVCVPF